MPQPALWVAVDYAAECADGHAQVLTIDHVINQLSQTDACGGPGLLSSVTVFVHDVAVCGKKRTMKALEADTARRRRVSGILERSYQRIVRVRAPLHALYREMDAVEGLVRFIPQIDSFDPDPDGGPALARGYISIGPLAYQITGPVQVERVDPPYRLRLGLRAPRLRTELEGTFEFFASAARETTLRYEATIRSGHPLMRRMRSSLIGLLEEHVDTVIDEAAIRGRRYTRAARLLSPHLQPHHYPGP